MDKLRVLNLYAGIGGNRKLWGNCEVTAVEMNPEVAGAYQSLYPGDKVVVGDAHQYLIENYNDFDFIWSSPPCQSHTRFVGQNQPDRYPDMSLYQQILFLRNKFNGLFVIENVRPYYTPLIAATTEIDRHLFWCNFFVGPMPALPKASDRAQVTMQKTGDIELMQDWLGIHLDKTIYLETHCPMQVYRNCVHPLIGKHIMDWSQDTIIDQADIFSLGEHQ